MFWLTLKNIISGFGSKFLILILGIIIPRIVIVSFGSELSGFISTITQICTYFALLEAGIGNSAVNALYSPLEKNDHNRANMVVRQARGYYRRATIIYIVVVISFAFIYPFLMPSTLDKSLMIIVILLQAAPSAVSYYFCAVYQQLLTADGKRYILENTQLGIYLLVSASKIFLILIGFDIIAVQFAFFAISLIKIPIVILYCKRKYPWLSFKEKTKEKLLHERSAFVVHEVSTTVFSNTDVFVVSVFCGFEMASVYTVYNMIFSSLNALVNTANDGLGFVLGYNLDKPKKTLEKVFDAYSIMYTFVVFVVMTTATVLATPFISLYTRGIDDVNYIYKWLPILFGLINVMSGARAISARLITVAGHARNTQNRSLIEMMINIAASVILVYYFGIYGALMGTIIALLYRMNDILIYTNKKILNRSSFKTYLGLLVFFSMFFILAYFSNMMPWNIDSYADFILCGMATFATMFLIYFAVILILEKDVVIMIFKYIKNKRAKIESRE